MSDVNNKTIDPLMENHKSANLQKWTKVSYLENGRFWCKGKHEKIEWGVKGKQSGPNLTSWPYNHHQHQS